MNDMQKFLMTNPEGIKALWSIVKLFHPDIPDYYLTNKGKEINVKQCMQVRVKYSWVTVYLKYQPIGQNYIRFASIGIDFRHNFFGAGITMEHFKESYHKSGYFEAWRFFDDYYYSRSDSFLQREKVDYLFKTFNVPKPTPKQMYDYYFRD